MIKINNLSKSYGHSVLFDKVNLMINQGEKNGFVGPNGAGKSTFFSIILRKEEITSGRIDFPKNIRIGYLPQEAHFESDVLILPEVVEGDRRIRHLVNEKKNLEKKEQSGLKRYGDILSELEFLGYYTLEYKAKAVLMGLGFMESDFLRPISQLSGGWQMRVLLAKLLVCRYDILLLDEPMNHLDLGAALWFKEYLVNFKGTFILISHDKDFLDQVTNNILVLENKNIVKVKGNYEDYKRIEDDKKSHLVKQSSEQGKKRKQLKLFIDRFHGQPNKASQVRAKKRVLDKMEIVELPVNRKESVRSFKFPTVNHSGYQVIKLEEVYKSYGDIHVYENFEFEIIRGEKAVLVGRNGAGKSTLLKMLAGVIGIDRGKRVVGFNTTIGYFSQRRMDVLNSLNTVLEEACLSSGGAVTGEKIRTILSLFLFSGDDVEKRVSVLSGGEKSRLILAKLLINPPNLLLLDEPTTHLDVDAVEALVKALDAYEGSIVFISHDIHFVRSVANTVFDVQAGRVKKFPGNFDYYWRKINERILPEENNIAKKDSKISGYKSKKKKATKVLDDQKSKSEIKRSNFKISGKIKKLRKEKEDIQLEYYAKKRTLDNQRSYHSEQTKEEYDSRVRKINERILEIEKEINELKDLFA